MENFYNWITQPVPREEVEIWFNVHNIIPERVELFCDIVESFISLVVETYLGEDTSETKIKFSEDDITNHFNWCWNKTIENFFNENIIIDSEGEHKDYMKGFLNESFYNQKDENIKKSIKFFVKDLFDLDKTFVKSDLDILTEVYKVFNRSVIHL